MTTIKFKYAIVAVTTLLFVTVSCVDDDLMNPKSRTALSDATAFDNVSRIENQIKGIYSAVKSGNMLGGRYFVYNDVRAENFLSNDPNRITARAAWEFSETAGDPEPGNLWGAAYTAINRANLFLDGMTAKGDAVAGTAAPAYRAEARFVRALAYYSLMQFFARPYTENAGNDPGLPLRLTGINGPGFSNLAKSSVGAIYTQIIADLDFAEQNLPLTRADAATNTSRAHRNTAIALKTRVYLSMGIYPKVIEEANKIVSAAAPFSAATGVAHALQNNIATVFTNFSTTESILSMPFTTTDAPGTQNPLGFYYRPNANAGAAGIFYLNPVGVVADAGWLATDSRRTAFIETHGGFQWLFKWRGAGPFLDWAPVMRYSEVLLNLAEATARTTAGVDTRALALLNAVRQRSDATTTLAPADNAALIASILQERNIEFLGEGIRSIDILRLNLAFPDKASIGDIEPENEAYLWPIPTGELVYNKLINENL